MKTRKKIHNINKTSVRYLPKRLSFKDKKKQSKMLLKSKKMYLKGKRDKMCKKDNITRLYEE